MDESSLPTLRNEKLRQAPPGQCSVSPRQGAADFSLHLSDGDPEELGAASLQCWVLTVQLTGAVWG